MKKSITILLAVFALLGAFLTSCTNEVAVQGEELVSVTFEEGSSRALTATVQEFDKDDYFWYYVAWKTDSTGLISGQTKTYDVADAVAVKSGKGLDGQVPGFSQGSWKFTLFAYAEAPTADQMGSFVYSGEATAVTLRKNGTNTVSVTVNPAEQGQGTLFIDMANIKLSEASSASHNTVAPQVSITKTKDAQTYEMVPGTNIEYKAGAGQWTVKVDYTDGDIIFATGTVIATVYPGLKTTVTGDVSELITYAQFDAKENPDLVKVTASSEATTYAGITEDVDLSGTVKEGTVEVKTVETSVAAADAQKIMAEMATNAGVALDSNTTMSLALNVDPTAATETSITYDISMSATLKVTEGELIKSSTTKDVEELDNVVIVEISMQKDLQDVEVYHKTTKMTGVDSKDDLANGKFYYDEENGKLYICTSTFSPFSISYKFIEYAASLNGKKYETLVEAFNAAVASGKKSTVYLLKDASGAGIFLAQNLGADITVDLGGHKYTCTGPAVGSTGTQTQAWHLEKNNKVTIKSGTLDCTSDAGVKMLIQNYCDLTLQDVAVDGTKLPGTGRYVLSGNNGDILITGKTDITAKTGNYAFDVCYTGYYPDGVRYVFDENYTGTVTGTIQFDVWGTLPETTYCSLTIKAGTFIGVFDIQEALRDRAKDDIHISGGSFDNDPTTYVLRGYKVDIVDNMYVVSKRTEGPASIIEDGEKLYFASLQDAIDAAFDGETVYLEYDYDAKTRVTIDGKSITLDGQNHSLSASQENISNGRTLNVWNSVNPSPEAPNVILRNLVVVGPTSGYSRGLNIGDGAKLTIEGCTISAGHYAINVITGSDGTTIDLKGSSVASGWAALNIWSRTDITVEGGTLSGVNDKSFDSEGWNCFSTIVFNSGEATAAGSTISCSSVEIIADTTTSPNENHQGLIDIRSTATGITGSFEKCTFRYTTNDSEFNGRKRNWMFKFTDNTVVKMTGCSFYIDESKVTVDDLPITVYTNESLYNSTVVINGEDILPLT